MLPLIRTAALCAAALALSTTLSAHADILASQTGGKGYSGSVGYTGQSFTVAGTGQYNDISFTFYDTSQAAIGAGDLYLFTSAYTGSPSGLSSAGAAVGVATANNNVFTFDPSMTLTAGTQYFAYSDSSFAVGARIYDAYPGGDVYYSSGAGSNFHALKQDANFTVTGTQATPAAAATPEPSSLALLSTGLLGVAGAVRRRFKQ